MGYALVLGIIFAGIFAYVSGSPFIYQNIYEVSPSVLSLLFSLNGIGLVLASQLTKLLAGRMQPRTIFLIGLCSAFFSSIAVLIVVLSHGRYLH